MRTTGFATMIGEIKEKNQYEATELNRKLNLFHIVRWALLLPVVFCGCSIVLVIFFHSLIFIVEYMELRNPFRIIAEFFLAITLFSYGLTFTFLVAVIAPKYKKSIAYSMCLFLCLLYLIAHFTYVCYIAHFPYYFSVWVLIYGHTVITVFYMLLGGVVAAAIIPSKNERN